jgi:hypothetical protein
VPAGPVGTVWGSGVWADTVWELGVWGDIGVIVGNTILDINTRIAVFLRTLYSEPNGDPTSLVVRYLNSLSGEYTARLKRLIEDATA